MASPVKQRKIIIGTLLVIFAFYNFLVYSQATNSDTALSESALRGERLYRTNNCTACHQLYGLGGYLGPDLTNVASRGENAENRIRTFLNLGYKSMPKFAFSEAELNDLVQFLKAVDRTGYYPDCSDGSNFPGWIKLKRKHGGTEQ